MQQGSVFARSEAVSPPLACNLLVSKALLHCQPAVRNDIIELSYKINLYKYTMDHATYRCLASR
jgi:hypothetical protein